MRPRPFPDGNHPLPSAAGPPQISTAGTARCGPPDRTHFIFSSGQIRISRPADTPATSTLNANSLHAS